MPFVMTMWLKSFSKFSHWTWFQLFTAVRIIPRLLHSNLSSMLKTLPHQKSWLISSITWTKMTLPTLSTLSGSNTSKSISITTFSASCAELSTMKRCHRKVTKIWLSGGFVTATAKATWALIGRKKNKNLITKLWLWWFILFANILDFFWLQPTN